MTTQYLENKSVSRNEAEQKLRAIFGTEDIFVIGQGFNINFTIPATSQLFEDGAYVVEWQVEALREFNWKITQFKSGVRGLTVWVKEISSYE